MFGTLHRKRDTRRLRAAGQLRAAVRRCCVLVLVAFGGCGGDDRARVILGTTHTLEDSGLLEPLGAAADTALPFRVTMVVAGSGEVLAMGGNGDVDVLLTHSPDDELAFITSGRGVLRHPLMHNDFLLVGPVDDPAGAAGAADAASAFAHVDSIGSRFVSRGDGSGTHRAELRMWAIAGVIPDGSSYVEAGAGMAEALRLANQIGAYTLADRATWTRLAGALPALRIIHEGDARLRNIYSVILPRSAASDSLALQLVEWLRSENVAELIGTFGRDVAGRPLFIPER